MVEDVAVKKFTFAISSPDEFLVSGLSLTTTELSDAIRSVTIADYSGVCFALHKCLSGEIHNVQCTRVRM